MYGLIAKLRTRPNRRNAVLAILAKATVTMPGCLAYVVARDPSDPDIIWITEAWQDKRSHDESLAIPAIEAATAKARPLLMGFETTIPIEPVGAMDLRQRGAHWEGTNEKAGPKARPIDLPSK
ncbi:MAG TPA: putative quinol monooxygenase [Pararhizobium sp.]|nr:putative quinol monooxygenase [Pararhizobium sp.]